MTSPLEAFTRKLARFPSNTATVELSAKGELVESIACEFVASREELAQELFESAQESAELALTSVQFAVRALDRDGTVLASFMLRVKPQSAMATGSSIATAQAQAQFAHRSEASEIAAALLRSNERLIAQTQGLIQQFGVGISAMASAQAASMQAMAARLQSAEQERDAARQQLDQSISLGTELAAELKVAQSAGVKVERLMGLFLQTPMVRGLLAEAREEGRKESTTPAPSNGVKQ